MARSKSSKRWLQRHFDDPFVKMAQEQGYRSRAVFKLLEIQEKDHILSSGMTIVDLGAAPGGWSQMAKQILGPKGRVIAMDILAIEPLDGIEFIQGDFTEDAVLQTLLDTVGGTPIDVVLSDMAPNFSGNKSVDQPGSIYLAELAFDFAKQTLSPGGTLLMKVFQGEGFDALMQSLRQEFKQVVTRKPKASRARSAEVYLLAKDFRPSSQPYK